MLRNVRFDADSIGRKDEHVHKGCASGVGKSVTVGMFAYEMTTEIVSDTLQIRGVIINRSGQAWPRVTDDGPLWLGVRTLLDRQVIGTVQLPAIEPDEEVPFEMDIPEGSRVGSYDVLIEPFRHGGYWFSDKGQAAHCTTIGFGLSAAFSRDHQVFGPELTHPYRGLPEWAFWKGAVADRTPETLEPMVGVPFTIGKQDRVATAGSCFAQRISAYLEGNGFTFFRTEAPLEEGGPMYSANYGNIYTPLQLHQLFRRAFGLLLPADIAWKRADGRLIDPFRPQLFSPGFATEAEVDRARTLHLLNVRRVFTESDVFVFTLGLTETWINAEDGVALPVTPGAVALHAGHGPYEMVNFNVEDITRQLAAFIDDVRLIRPNLRIVLTVSPVPLVATYEQRHVLVSTTFSKAVLRAAADATERAYPNVSYFPSYEIVTGPLMGNRYFEDDLRSITPEAVAKVMQVFSKSYLTGGAPDLQSRPPAKWTPKPRQARHGDDLRDVLCDEELLEV